MSVVVVVVEVFVLQGFTEVDFAHGVVVDTDNGDIDTFVAQDSLSGESKGVSTDAFVTLAVVKGVSVVAGRPKTFSHADIGKEVVEGVVLVVFKGAGVVEVVVSFPSQMSGTPDRRFLGMLDKQAEKRPTADLHVPAEKVQQPIHSHSSLLQARSQMSPPLARVWNIWKVGHSSFASPTHLPSWKVQQPMKWHCASVYTGLLEHSRLALGPFVCGTCGCSLPSSCSMSTPLAEMTAA